MNNPFKSITLKHFFEYCSFHLGDSYCLSYFSSADQSNLREKRFVLGSQVYPIMIVKSGRLELATVTLQSGSGGEKGLCQILFFIFRNSGSSFMVPSTSYLFPVKTAIWLIISLIKSILHGISETDINLYNPSQICLASSLWVDSRICQLDN